jgi:hypothetical protein
VTGLRPQNIRWEDVERCFTDPIFDIEKIESLLLNIGEELPPNRDREDLVGALNSAASGYAFDYWRQVQPSASEELEQARALSAACRMVLEAVGITQNPLAPRPIETSSLFPTMGRGGLYASASTDGLRSGEEAVLGALRAVRDLKGWADSFATVARKRMAIRSAMPKKKGRRDNRALSRLLEGLTNIYFSAWDELPALKSSRSTGSADLAEVAVAAGGLEGRMYETGEPVPVGFARLLWEVMTALRERGIPAPESPGAVEQAWRRWRRLNGEEWSLTK